MLVITPTASERKEARLLPVHLDAAVRALRDDGFVVIENAVDTAHIDAVYAAMVEDINSVRRQKGEFPGFSNVPARRTPDLLFKDILMNPIAEQIMTALMGGRIQCGMYSSNVTMPGTGDQKLHVDMAPLKEGDNLDYPCNCVVMNVPLVEFTLENGATEIWPGTHKIPRDIGEFWLSQHLQNCRRPVRPPERATIKKGSFLIRDIRLWHRGTPNQTDIIRPMIAMICNGKCRPELGDVLKIPSPGKYPRESESFFKDNPLIFYNPEYEA
jgi:ectoine hydroxylase-related dioxygenase (phytanoyl-CoA dioxygenase family)